ncbi:efflux RND transporter periplasmic adaptor subunit [Nitrospira moscoviensis]|uniref:Putative Membrane-fusion protein of multidrug efflux transporter n=1 Tax=Nitrospira moscoviensis TaxID=42253 RepID=A0A0K2GD92_NITMO|nr:efflux RND transporter periplasmic adaptor subunit [Nitrospira moscoviensis]ALA58915.1 Putative Membrane-fusion protein of multidrug efflux transporter [Nitrospira moscoviensis]
MKIIGLTGIGAIGMGLLAFVLTREPDTEATTNHPDRLPHSTENATVVGEPHAVQVVKPQRRDIAETLSLPANISPWAQATLYAKVSGYLTAMKADKGDRVTKGQLLAVIDAPEIKEQYEQAEAQYEIKRVTARRLSNVWKENADVIAKQDVDVAEAEAKAAKHLADTRRTMLGYTKVYAPFSGVITARFADPGALIQSAINSATQTAPLYTIMDLDRVRVYASVPQEAAAYAKPGTPVVLHLKDAPDKDVRAAVTRTTASIDPATRTLLVEIDLPNQEDRFQPGMFVNVKIFLQHHPNALTLPGSAVVPAAAGQGASVLVVENQAVRRVPIKTGLDDGVAVEIVEGLTGREDVVVVGKAGLADGTPVKAAPYNFPVGTPSKQKY